MKERFLSFRKKPAFTGFMLFLAAVALNAAIQGPAQFFGPKSLNTLFSSNLPFLLVVMGHSVLLISGTMDISIGIQLALVNVVTIMTMQEWGLHFALACGMGIGAALLASVVCWLFVSVFRLPRWPASPSPMPSGRQRVHHGVPRAVQGVLFTYGTSLLGCSRRRPGLSAGAADLSLRQPHPLAQHLPWGPAP